MFVFISYRRGGSRHIAGRLRDHISWEIGVSNVFLDSHSIQPGELFPDRIRQAIQKATHILVVIGPGWDGGVVSPTPDAAGEWGPSGVPAVARPSNRILQKDDLVRQEIEMALLASCQTIPVLVDEAQMPTANQVPVSLLPLLRLNAFTIHNDKEFGDQIRPMLTYILGREPRGGDTAPSIAIKAVGGAVLGFLAFLLFSAFVQLVLGLDAVSLFSFTDRESAEALWQLLAPTFTVAGALALPVLRRRWTFMA